MSRQFFLKISLFSIFLYLNFKYKGKMCVFFFFSKKKIEIKKPSFIERKRAGNKEGESENRT